MLTFDVERHPLQQYLAISGRHPVEVSGVKQHALLSGGLVDARLAGRVPQRRWY